MRYDAFISYRHSELDMYIAKKVHRGLETFKVPRAVAKKSGKKRINRVFRDQEELPIGSDLGNNIQTALAESEFLIVICSPRTPESYWVLKEIDTFIGLHGREHVLAILIEGEPQDAFPKQLQVDEEGNPVEPLAADVRGAAKREIDRKLRTELIRLAAPLLYCSYDDLRQRHRERRMKKLMYAASAAAALGVAFGLYSAYNAAMIRENYQQKQINQSKYLASTSLALLEEGDRQAAALVALAALPAPENDRPYVADAQYALSEALNCYDIGSSMSMDRSLKHDLPVSEFVFDAAGERLLSIDQGGTIYVWDMENGALLAKLAPELDESGYVMTPIYGMVSGEHILICDKEGIRSVGYDGTIEWQEPASFVYCDMDPKAGIIAGISGEYVLFYDMESGTLAGEIQNESEYSFGSAYAFSQDKTKFAVSHICDGNAGGYVTVYDFAAGSSKIYPVSAGYVSEVAFSADGGVIAVSLRHSDLRGASVGDTAAGFIERIDCGSGRQVWQQEFEYQPVGVESSSTDLKCRKYQEEETGVVFDQVIMSVDQTVYTWDAATGEAVSQVKVTGGIRAFRVSSNSCYGYLAESNGTVDIVDLNRGINYTNLGIETGKNVTDMGIKNGALVVSAYASPALTVMKYHEGYGRQEITSYEENVDEVTYSERGTYYAVRISRLSPCSLCFYRSLDDSPVGEWTQGNGYYAASGFLDDTHFFYVDTLGGITFYDLDAGTAEQMEPAEDMDVMSAVCDRNGSKALLYDASRYVVVDLQQRTFLQSGDVGDYIFCGILSEDGSRIYCNLKDQGLCAVDAASGSIEALGSEEYRLIRGTESQSALVLSPDGGLLAAACVDGILRVWDVEEKSTVAEIPFASVSRRFIQFSEDGKKLMLQGDDYYFRVYDLRQQAFTYIATQQYYQIHKATADEKSGIMSLVTSTNMILLDSETYERVAQAEGGLAYLPEQKAVFSSRYGTLYRFPYMTLDMLLEEERAQFGDASLTQFEKIQYHVD